MLVYVKTRYGTRAVLVLYSSSGGLREFVRLNDPHETDPPPGVSKYWLKDPLELVGGLGFYEIKVRGGQLTDDAVITGAQKVYSST